MTTATAARSGPSNLTRPQRLIARQSAVNAAMLGYHHAKALHYTELSPARWQGIDHKLIAAKGQFPTEADCSAFYSWCIWNGVYVNFKVGDVVNALHWTGGFTGTMSENGIEVPTPSKIHVPLRADAVIYGTSYPYLHTAIIVTHDKGKPMVVSNGSEGGPYYVPYDYRDDVAMIRRYI